MALKGSVEFLVARKGTHQISMACREFARNGFHPLLLYLKQNPNPSHKTKSHRRPNMLVQDSNTHTHSTTTTTTKPIQLHSHSHKSQTHLKFSNKNLKSIHTQHHIAPNDQPIPPPHYQLPTPQEPTPTHL